MHEQTTGKVIYAITRRTSVKQFRSSYPSVKARQPVFFVESQRSFVHTDILQECIILRPCCCAAFCLITVLFCKQRQLTFRHCLSITAARRGTACGHELTCKLWLSAVATAITAVKVAALLRKILLGSPGIAKKPGQEGPCSFTTLLPPFHFTSKDLPLKCKGASPSASRPPKSLLTCALSERSDSYL